MIRFLNIIILVLLVSSCGTKKKVVERSTESSVAIESKALETKTENDITSNVTFIHEGSKLTIKPSDPNKPSMYRDIEFQNAEIIKSDVNQSLQIEEKDLTKNYLTNFVKSEKAETKKTVNKNIDVDRSFNVFDWLWLFLAIAIVLFVVRLYLKKINPIKWITDQLRR